MDGFGFLVYGNVKNEQSFVNLAQCEGVEVQDVSFVYVGESKLKKVIESLNIIDRLIVKEAIWPSEIKERHTIDKTRGYIWSKKNEGLFKKLSI